MADRKDLILAAATELFAEKGFQATPTAEVAKRAEVSEGVIFYHFQTKEGILFSLFEKIMGQFTEDTARVIEQAPTGLEAVLGCLELNYVMLRERSQEMLVLVRDMPHSFGEPSSPYYDQIEQRVDRLQALLLQAVQKGLEDGSIRPCEPVATAYLVFALMVGTGRTGLLGRRAPADLNRETLEFCRRALSPVAAGNEDAS